MLKRFKIFVEQYILQFIAKLNPKLYHFIRHYAIRVYSEIINMLRYRDKYFFYTINIENISHCNRKCDYCPNSQYNTPHEYMDENIFKEIISQLKAIKYSGIIAYVFYGEPLIDERLGQFAKLAKKELPNVIQIVYSNGDYLTEELAINLLNSGIDKFVVTVHDKDPTNGLKRLTPIQAKLNGKMNLTSSSELVLANRGGSIDVSKYENTSNFTKCPGIKLPVITYNGDMLICCQDYHRNYVMGNIMKENIVSIWNGKYKNIRKELLSKNKATLPICKKCLNRE